MKKSASPRSIERPVALASTARAPRDQSTDNAEILTVPEAAQFLRLSCRTLARLGEVGLGPRRLQISERRIAFLKSDLLAWANSRACDKSRA